MEERIQKFWKLVGAGALQLSGRSDCHTNTNTGDSYTTLLQNSLVSNLSVGEGLLLP